MNTVKVIIEVLLLSPFFYLASKIGFKQAGEEIKKHPKLIGWKRLLEYIYMMAWICLLCIVLLLASFQGHYED